MPATSLGRLLCGIPHAERHKVRIRVDKGAVVLGETRQTQGLSSELGGVKMLVQGWCLVQKTQVECHGSSIVNLALTTEDVGCQGEHLGKGTLEGNETLQGHIALDDLDENLLVAEKRLWPSEYGRGATMAAIDKMLGRLGTDHIDLLLQHQQFGDYLGAWADMEDAVAAGKVRAIGLSNFESARLEEVCEAATIKPAALQVECHPYYQQHALKARVAAYGTVLESWYPLGHGDPALLAEPLFAQLGAKYGKTAAQVILRWHIQEGNVIFPRATNPAHIADNMGIFDFALTQDEMAQVAALDKGVRYFNMTLEEQEANLGAWSPAD